LQRIKILIGSIAQNVTQTRASDPWKIRGICSRAVPLLERAAIIVPFIMRSQQSPLGWFSFPIRLTTAIILTV